MPSSVQSSLPLLSYCTNIHPAYSWAQIAQELVTHVPAIRRHLLKINSPLAQLPLGIGLWLPNQASIELTEQPHLIHRFTDWLTAQNAVVATLNGFPYGTFHSRRVKENVFRPDWTTHERLAYTTRLAQILSIIGNPHTDSLAISTLPGSYSAFHADNNLIFDNLYTIADRLDQLSEQYNKTILLALEPEPFGHFHNTRDCIDFFDKLRSFKPNNRRVCRHIALTYDTCHFAVLDESPAHTLQCWRQYEIPVAKVQFSNAPQLVYQGQSTIDTLQMFNDGVYFHQASLTRKSKTVLFADLPELIAYLQQHTDQTQLLGSIIRLHCHIPLHMCPPAPLGTTAYAMTATMQFYKQSGSSSLPHFEVETYTHTTLPATLRTPIAAQIASELDYLARLYNQS